MNVEAIYKRRFTSDIEFRQKMWSLLCRDFFQKYVPEDSTILEIGAGYCEFINHIRAKKKIALDMNPDVEIWANPDVETIIRGSEIIEPLANESVNIVFTSNFFRTSFSSIHCRNHPRSEQGINSRGQVYYSSTEHPFLR